MSGCLLCSILCHTSPCIAKGKLLIEPSFLCLKRKSQAQIASSSGPCKANLCMCSQNACQRRDVEPNASPKARCFQLGKEAQGLHCSPPQSCVSSCQPFGAETRQQGNLICPASLQCPQKCSKKSGTDCRSRLGSSAVHHNSLMLLGFCGAKTLRPHTLPVPSYRLSPSNKQGRIIA